MAKTTQECLDYIKQQPWYNSYKENIKKYPPRTPIEEVSNRDLILNAFYFHNTIEGSSYWHIINKRYLKWYDESENDSNEEEVMPRDCEDD